MDNFFSLQNKRRGEERKMCGKFQKKILLFSCNASTLDFPFSYDLDSNTLFF